VSDQTISVPLCENILRPPPLRVPASLRETISENRCAEHTLPLSP
jgi:hypothetical protein